MIPRHELISPDYCETQKALHAHPRGYGGRGDLWAETVLAIARAYDVGSILDYGSGQGSLGKAVRAQGFVCRDYDPARPGVDGPPAFADMVTCTDVLEHIEPPRLPAVLAHIRSLARRVALLVIATRPSNKHLPDGRNAHLIIEDDAWWQARVLEAGFTLEPPPTVLPAQIPACYLAVVRP